MTRRALIGLSVLILASPAMAQMYATTGGGGTGAASLYTMNQATGAVTLVGQPDFGAAAPVYLGMPGIDFASDGTLFAVTGTDELIPNMLVQLDPATGALLSVVGSLTNGTDIRDIAIQPGTDTIFGTGTNGALRTVDSATGGVSSVGGTADYGPIAFGADGTLYMAEMACGSPNKPDRGDNVTQAPSGALYTVDPSTGAVTFVADLTHFYMGLGMGPDGMLYGADFPGNGQFGTCGVGTFGDIYRIDPATGAETFLGSNAGYMIHDIAFSPNQAGIPTLGGWGIALLALALALGGSLLAVRRLHS